MSFAMSGVNRGAHARARIAAAAQVRAQRVPVVFLFSINTLHLD
jgi:hypothetical protein